MIITLMGTGSIWSKKLSSCMLVDNKILVDCPNGLFKASMRKGIDLTNIDLCLITHYHGDHYFDLPFLLLAMGMTAIRQRPIYICGPKGLEGKITELFNLAYPDQWEKVKMNSKIQFVEYENLQNKQIINGYSISSYEVEHNGFQSYGYTITKSGKTVGITGDTVLCCGVRDILNKSDLAFVDMTFEKNSKSHMGFNNMLTLKEQYKNTIIIPTHMGDEVRGLYLEKYGDLPEDWQVYNI